MKTTYEKFLEAVSNLKITVRTHPLPDDWSSVAKNKKVPPYIFIQWCTGGASGGSCWGG